MRRASKWVAWYTPALLACVLVSGRTFAGEDRKQAGPAQTGDAVRGAECLAAKPEAERCQAATPLDTAAPTTVQPGESGLVVVRDPQTGELRAPEGAEAAELLRQAVPANNYSDEGLVEVALPRGGYTKDLQGRYQEYFVLVRGADGQLKPACVNDPATVGLGAKPQAAAPSPLGEDR